MVSQKVRGEKMSNQPICYCFGYTVSAIEHDVIAHGKSQIMEKIMAEKKAGGCQCVTKNPKGR